MADEIATPAWIHRQITAAEYESWHDEGCAGIEIMDGMVVDQYAKAGIAFYWRVEQAATGVPLAYTYILDPATRAYRTGEMYTGTVSVAAPFAVEIDLGAI